MRWVGGWESGEGARGQRLDRQALLVQGLLLDGRQIGLSRGLPLLDNAKTGLKPGGEGLAAVTGDALHDFVDATVRSNEEADGVLGHQARWVRWGDANGVGEAWRANVNIR
jgi:hypothetical protein